VAVKRTALLALFLVAACGTIGAQAHDISLAFKTGDTYKYKLQSTGKQLASFSGMSVPIELDTSAGETVTVKSVDSSGVADLTISFSNFTLKTVSAGITNTTTGVTPNATDLKIKSNGTVVSIDGSTVMAGSPLAAFAGIGGGFFISAVLPDKAVKVGDTWSKSYDQTEPGGGPAIHIISNSKYLRDETINGVTAAVVETKSDGGISMTGSPVGSAAADAGLSMNGTLTTDVTTWIDPSSHRIIKSHSTMHDSLTLNFPTEMPSSIGNNSMPALQGPITATGDSTQDLTPA
jgi:hypothetical protein